MRRSHLLVGFMIAVVLGGIAVPRASAVDTSQTAELDQHRSARITTTSSYLYKSFSSEGLPGGGAGYSGAPLMQSNNVSASLFSNETMQVTNEDRLNHTNEVLKESYSTFPVVNSTEIDIVNGTSMKRAGIVLQGNAVSSATLKGNPRQVLTTVEHKYLTLFSAATSAGIKMGFVSNLTVGIQAADPWWYPPPIKLTKEGHWFPNQDYSRIRYEVNLVPGLFGYVSFYIHIDCVQDIYGRNFRVFLDSSNIYNGGIGSGGFDGTIVTYWVSAGVHTVTIEIQWGYYSAHGWKLLTFSSDTGWVIGEFFPKVGFSQLRWDTYLGPSTVALVDQIISCGDPWLRYFRIYVDGVKKVETTAPVGHTTFNVGDYSKRSLHEIAIEVQWGNYMDWGWKTLAFYTGYAAVYYEVDYMPGHQPDTSVFSRISEWYMTYGYEKPVFVLDGEVPHEDVMRYDPSSNIDDYTNLYYNVYFGHINQVGLWKYVLFGHFDQDQETFGWTEMLLPIGQGGNKIFVADQRCDNFAADPNDSITEAGVQRVVLMHEGGHSINIIDYYPGTYVEHYCEFSWCVMAGASADNCQDLSYYCIFHWGLRQYPP